jgi:hypothetical protein
VNALGAVTLLAPDEPAGADMAVYGRHIPPEHAGKACLIEKWPLSKRHADMFRHIVEHLQSTKFQFAR